LTRSAQLWALAFSLLISMEAVLAQPFPSRPIRIVAGQAAGGHTDALARVIATEMSGLLKQPVVVENRGGVGGTIAAEAVARSQPDGYTLLLAGSSNLGMGLLVNKSVQYDARSLVSVGGIARVPYAIAVHASVPARTLGELVAYARANPGKLNFVTSGPGSTSSLGFEMLKRAGGIDMVAVAYKGSGVAVNDFVAGHVHVMFTDLSMLSSLATRGSARVLAVAARTRVPTAPSLPTVGEEGFADLVIEPWYGLVAPAGTPPETIGILSSSLRESLRAPDVRRHFDRLGYLPLESSPAELDAIIDREVRTLQAYVETERRQGP
jgi:tripartite-type tricarboxylate transporter receptor subunit TctC